MTPPTFKFYKTTEETWAGMLEACQGAQVSIDIEHYIFGADNIGNKFLEILKEKSRAGVKVRLLLDTVGSYALYISAVPDELRKAGIDIKFFNPISPWRIPYFTSWFFRDHNKIIVVDKKIGFTGGTGIKDNMALWRDTNAWMEGDVVTEMCDSFERMWQRGLDRGIIGTLKKIRVNGSRRYFITNAPFFRKRFLYHSFITALQGAKKSIHLTTPYFIPDRRLIRVLRLAVLRGVEVKVIVPKTIDVLLVATASHSSFETILKSGVRIFKYELAVLHAKTAVVDGEWASFGSFNLDSLSFVYNFEANVISTDPKCALEIQNHFQEDLRHSREVLYSEWIQRPFYERLREFFIAPFRGFL